MLFGYCLDMQQGGLYEHDSMEYADAYFGCNRVMSGSMKVGQRYMYFYDANDWDMMHLRLEHKPDVVLYSDLCECDICLWEVE